MNHFATIWFSPGFTIRNLLDTRPAKLFYPLAAVAGITTNLLQVVQRKADVSSGFTVLEVFGVNIVVGAFYGIAMFSLMSYLLSGLGRLFGVRGSSQSARTVLAWASVPQIPLFAVIILFFLVAGENLIYHSVSDLITGVKGTFLQIFSLIYYLVWWVLGIWTIVIGVTGLAEAFGISKLKTVLIYLLTLVVFVVFIWVGLFVWGLF